LLSEISIFLINLFSVIIFNYSIGVGGGGNIVFGCVIGYRVVKFIRFIKRCFFLFNLVSLIDFCIFILQVVFTLRWFCVVLGYLVVGNKVGIFILLVKFKILQVFKVAWCSGISIVSVGDNFFSIVLVSRLVFIFEIFNIISVTKIIFFFIFFKYLFNFSRAEKSLFF
jgi:hypothetical protein